MEVHDLPVASEPPQHERAPLARRFAAEVKRDDSDSTEFLDQQVQWTNWADRAWCTRRAPARVTVAIALTARHGDADASSV